MILLIDNYDSFVHNLARYFRRLGQETHVVRNNEITSTAIHKLAPQAIVLSPGPCTPAEAGNSLNLVGEFYNRIPLLGICLGHQIIAEALGAKVVCAAEPMHGRTSTVEHSGSLLFTNIPSPLTICRYHSLIVESATFPESLQVTATIKDGQIMAFQHTNYPAYGVQFHPEAILTEYGYRLLANFLTLAGVSMNVSPEGLAASEQRVPQQALSPPILKQPITF